MPEYFVKNDNVLEEILKEFNKTEKDLEQDIELLVKWFKLQHHLPETPSRKMIRFFLIANKFSTQLAKQRIDMYYTIRGLLPDLFAAINPKYERMKRHQNTCQIIPLPKLRDNKYRVIFVKELNVPLNQMDSIAFIGRFLDMQEVRINEDLSLSNVLLIDCQHININHTVAFTPVHCRMAVKLLDKVYSSRLKEIHLINHNAVMPFFVNLFGSFVSQKLIKRIKFHDSLDSLKESLPLDVLPEEYGGTLPPIAKLKESWLEKIYEYQDRFDSIENMVVDEKLRSVPSKDVETFGVQGSFKSLTID